MGGKLIYKGVTYEGELVSNSGKLNMNHSMVGETLTVDSLLFSIITDIKEFVTSQDDNFYTFDDEIFFVNDPALVYSAMAPGELYSDDALIGKYYLKELHQVGKKEFQLMFVSAINLLDRSKHPGGLYSGTPAGDIIAEIMGDINYTIDVNAAAVPIFGYLPYGSRRSNLHYVLMAIGGAVRNASDGSLAVTSLSDTLAGTFGLDRVFEGGTLIDKVPATAIEVTEHNYFETPESVVLFEGNSLSTETIIFNEPIHSLSITGGTIIDFGVNHCTFSGVGSVILTGKKYQHVTRVITAGTEPSGSPDDVVMSVTENTVLTPNNAADVAERLYNYLTLAQSIQAEVLFGSERPGDVVSVIHPYTRESVTACIKSMDVSIGLKELRANSEFLIGYTPPSLIDGFQNYVLLAGSGTWNVPEGVEKIRVILAGSGDGGFGGRPGETGSTTNGGAGGDGGQGGKGGNIFEINLNVTPGQEFIYSCAFGGSGGISNTSGTDGGNTTFGDYSSFVGRKYPYGYYEPKSGLTFGENGVHGYDGGAGNGYYSLGPDLYHNGIWYYTGNQGADKYAHGILAYGGCGGGASIGNNGGNGQKADVSEVGSTGTYTAVDGKGGTGAKGGDASDSSSTEYGKGGTGGNGGGGGGAAFNYPFGGPGVGGAGGKGGTGGPGLIIVYY